MDSRKQNYASHEIFASFLGPIHLLYGALQCFMRSQSKLYGAKPRQRLRMGAVTDY